MEPAVKVVLAGGFTSLQHGRLTLAARFFRGFKASEKTDELSV